MTFVAAGEMKRHGIGPNLPVEVMASAATCVNTGSGSASGLVTQKSISIFTLLRIYLFDILILHKNSDSCFRVDLVLISFLVSLLFCRTLFLPFVHCFSLFSLMPTLRFRPVERQADQKASQTSLAQKSKNHSESVTTRTVMPQRKGFRIPAQFKATLFTFSLFTLKTKLQS